MPRHRTPNTRAATVVPSTIMPIVAVRIVGVVFAMAEMPMISRCRRAQVLASHCFESSVESDAGAMARLIFAERPGWPRTAGGAPLGTSRVPVPKSTAIPGNPRAYRLLGRWGGWGRSWLYGGDCAPSRADSSPGLTSRRSLVRVQYRPWPPRPVVTGLPDDEVALERCLVAALEAFWKRCREERLLGSIVGGLSP
jgi:hypothetical protein